MLVTSTSTTWVSCAEPCSDSTIRVAMILRSRDIFTVVPRNGDGADPDAVPEAAGAAAAGAAAAGAAAAGCCWACCWVCWAWAASRTSCLRIRPPTPVPVTAPRSTPCWAAILRTSGVT